MPKHEAGKHVAHPEIAQNSTQDDQPTSPGFRWRRMLDTLMLLSALACFYGRYGTSSGSTYELVIRASIIAWMLLLGSRVLLALGQKSGCVRMLGCVSIGSSLALPIVLMLPQAHGLFDCSAARVGGHAPEGLEAIGRALRAYRAAEGSFPTTGVPDDSLGSLMLLHPRYLRDLSVLVRQGEELPDEPYERGSQAWEEACGHCYYDNSISPAAEPDRMIMWERSVRASSGVRYVLLVSGEVRFATDDEFRKLRSEAGHQSSGTPESP